MLQKFSRLKVADNSGAKEVMVIGIVGSTRKRYAYIGDKIKCAVKSAIPGATVKKGDVVDAVIVRTAKESRRNDGTYIRFGENAAVILAKEQEPVGTRIFGPIARELKDLGYTTIVSRAPEVL